MTSARICLLLYHDGIIEYGKDGVQYSQSTNWMVMLSSSLSHQELLDHLYNDILMDREKYEIKLRCSPNMSGQLMQSKYILVSIDDYEDVQKMLTFPLKFSECAL